MPLGEALSMSGLVTVFESFLIPCCSPVMITLQMNPPVLVLMFRPAMYYPALWCPVPRPPLCLPSLPPLSPHSSPPSTPLSNFVLRTAVSLTHPIKILKWLDQYAACCFSMFELTGSVLRQYDKHLYHAFILARC